MILETVIEQHEESYAPPEQEVLRVSLVGDVVFLTIAKWDETRTTRTLTDVASVAVPHCDLMNAIASQVVSNKRREVAKDPNTRLVAR